LEAFAAEDLERVMSVYADDAVLLEYSRADRGAEEIREKHMKPEFAEYTIPTFKAADRVVRGRNGLAYVVERDIIEL
jgi:ketosteroid isomerase-like protein